MDRKTLIDRLRMDEFTPPAPAQSCELSLFGPEDALGVARLIYCNYGDQHPFDYVYDPDEIARLFASGSQYALVARSATGQVLGMIGLYRCAPWPAIFELAQLLLHKGQHGRGMARNLWRAAMEKLAPLTGAGFIFGESVCTHAFSQKMCLATGMVPCGLMAEAIPAAAYEGAKYAMERTSLMLHMKIMESDRQRVHMPHDYRDLFARYIETTPLEREVLDSPAVRLEGESLVEAREFSYANLAKVLVRRPGSDLEAVAAQSERSVGPQGSVQFVFDLGRPDTPDAVRALRERGYSFCGFLPRWFGSDGLAMQRRREKTDPGLLTPQVSEAVYLADFIKADMHRVAAASQPWGSS